MCGAKGNNIPIKVALSNNNNITKYKCEVKPQAYSNNKDNREEKTTHKNLLT